MSLPGAADESTDPPATILEQLNRPVTKNCVLPLQPAVQVQRSSKSENDDDVDDVADQGESAQYDDDEDDDEKELSDNISVATVVDQSTDQIDINENCDKEQQYQGNCSKSDSHENVAVDVIDSERDQVDNAGNFTRVKNLFDTEEVLNLELQQPSPEVVDDPQQQQQQPQDDQHLSEKVCHHQLISEQVNENYSANLNTNIVNEYLAKSEKLILAEKELQQRSVIDVSEYNKLQDDHGDDDGLISNRNNREISPPPVPLETYRWEEARRARVQVGKRSSPPQNPFYNCSSLRW